MCFLSSAGGCLVFGQNWIPPHLPMAIDLNCRVSPSPDKTVMQAEAVVNYANPERYPEWRLVLGRYGKPLRNGKDVYKSRIEMEQVCNRWLKAVDAERTRIGNDRTQKENR